MGDYGSGSFLGVFFTPSIMMIVFGYSLSGTFIIAATERLPSVR